MSGRIRNFYEFGPFRLDPEKLSLWRDGEPIPLTPKAAETLLALIQQNGKLVEREALMKAIWPDTFVEDGNLNFYVSMLRRALASDETGEQYIQTIPRRGYRFVADVRAVTEETPALVVEKHTQARVVIEERELSGNVDLNTGKAMLPVTTRGRRIRSLYAGAALASFALIALAVWFFIISPRMKQPTTAATPQIRSVAILPLKTLDQDEKSKAMALGLTDLLINRLGSLNRFVVRPLNVVSGYGESNNDPLQFGETVKADAVLEGSLQTVENRLRVNVRLWSVRNGAQLWQGSFDSAEAEFFHLQDAISTKVTQSLVSGLLEKDRDIVAKRYTQNAEAFRAYVRGRAIMDSRNPDSAERAMDEFNRAVALDPTFALGYAGLAHAFSRLAFRGSGEAAEELYARSKASAQKALALDPELPEAYAALGNVRRIYDWDWSGAEKNFQRAIELNPNFAKAHLWYSLLHSNLGKNDEALTELKRAMEIDPISQDIKAGHITVLEGRREYTEALALSREYAKFDNLPKRAEATFLFHLGKYAEVIEISEHQLAEKSTQRFVWLSFLATAYHRTGQAEKSDETLKQLEELAQTDTKALYSLAENYTELGRFDEALAVLEKCFAIREERMMWLKVEPRFVGLRNDSRFQNILRKMNLAV